MSGSSQTESCVGAIRSACLGTAAEFCIIQENDVSVNLTSLMPPQVSWCHCGESGVRGALYLDRCLVFLISY